MVLLLYLFNSLIKNIDQAINIEKELFYKIISDLNRYENILLDLNNPIEQLQIRKNLNEILIK